jgi:hypothetical protein
MMDRRFMRLLGIFARNISMGLAYCAAMFAYWGLIIWLDWPWGFIVALGGLAALVLWWSWYLAKMRLDQLEYKEKRLADQLVNSD